MQQPLAFAAVGVGAVLMVAGSTNSSLASVLKGRPDKTARPTPTGAAATGGTAAPAAGAPGGGSAAGESVAQLAMRYFQSKGLTRAQAAGIVGNLQQESGLNPAEAGGYLAQWGGGRLAGLERFAARQGAPVTSAPVQLEWIWQELTTTERGTLLALKRTTSPRQAARVFSGSFERPGIPDLGNRESYAESAFAGAGG